MISEGFNMWTGAQNKLKNFPFAAGHCGQVEKKMTHHSIQVPDSKHWLPFWF
jgi:hypothetical protein